MYKDITRAHDRITDVSNRSKARNNSNNSTKTTVIEKRKEKMYFVFFLHTLDEQ